MRKIKTFATRLRGIVPILICTVIGIISIAFIGCDETGQMIKPIVSEEPADTPPPTTVGDVKQPEEPTDVEEPTKPTEPTPPADTTPPMVVDVAWYSDWQLTQAIADDVRPGDTIYTVVVFSEPMLHSVADDDTARPALSIVIDGVATRYRVAASGNTFASGSTKPLHGNTGNFVCKYTIPADASGTIALRVGGATADLAGNTVNEVSEHSRAVCGGRVGSWSQHLPPSPWVIRICGGRLRLWIG